MHLRAVLVILLFGIAPGCTSTAQDAADTCPSGTAPYARDAVPAGGIAKVHETWCAAEDGAASGPYHQSELNGQADVDGQFAHGLADGTWRYWDATGAYVAAERNYRQGQAHGTWTTWRDAKSVATVHQWAYGQACGDWQLHLGEQILVSNKYPPCESIQQDVNNLPVSSADTAPKTVDFGWDGLNCSGIVVKDSEITGDGATCTDASGKREGPHARWHANSGSKWTDGTYSHDQATGTWRSWFPSGALQSRGDYKDDLKTGEWRTWFSDGTPESQEIWLNGKRDGAARTWFPGGIARSSGSWSGGVKTGVWVEYSPAGTPLQKANYDENGALDGVFEQSFAEGPTKESGSWSHGKRVGEWTTFYPNGAVASKGKYINGIQEGLWHFGLSNGDPDTDVPYVHGYGAGESTVWTRQDGLLVRTLVNLVDGLAQGPVAAVYDVSGKKAGAWTYVDNRRDGTMQHWHENGTQALDGWFIYGVAHGPWRTWYADGTHEGEANFLFGALDGPYSEWWPDGKPKTLGNYVKDKKSGVWQMWTQDGKLSTKTYDGLGNPIP